MPVAQSADGVLHEFPDGTPQSVMDGAMLNYARSNLGAPEPENGVIGNLARGIGERASKVAGGLGRALFTAVDPIAQPIERGLEKIGIPQTMEIGPNGVSFRHSTEADYAAPGGQLTQDMIRAAENVKLGYKPGTTFEDVKKRPLTSIIPFALEQGIVSAPDMAAAIAALPAYVVARTGEIGQTRAKNDERSDANLGDLVAALPAAVGSALLERIGTRGILGLGEVAAQGVKGVIKETGKAGLKEGATETGQEFIENIGEELGTKKGVDVASMGDRMLAAAVGGAGFGAPVRAVGATAQALRGDQSSAPPPPPPGAPAAAAPPPTPGAPPLRTVTIGTIPPQDTWKVDKDGNQIEPPPTPTPIDILSEPDEDGLQTIRYPDGSVVQAPASGIESRLIPEAPVAPTKAEAPAAPPEDEPTFFGGPGITDVTEPPPAVEPQTPPPKKIKKVFTVEDDEVATAPPPVLEPEPAAVVERPPLPADLSKAAPRLGQFQLNFENDLDKAIYIANSNSSSRAKDRFVNWLKDDQGFSDPEIKSLGAQIKTGILNISRSGANPTEPMRLPAYAAPKPAPVGKIPDIGVAAQTPAMAAPVTEEAAPQRIKLGSRETLPGIKSFMEDYQASTKQNPLNTRSVVHGDYATSEISPSGRDIRLSDIRSLQPGQGGGTRALKELTALADKHNVPITGTASVYHSGSKYINSSKKLRDWYKKQGFTVSNNDDGEGGYDIKYYPSAPTPTPTTVAAPTLPAVLAVAKPRHIGHPVDWTGRDVERAAYIATSDVTPAAKVRFVEWLSRNNIPDDQVASIGTQVRSNLDQASAAAPKPTAPLKAPAVFGVAAPAAPAVTIKATPKVPPQVAAAVKSKKGSVLQVALRIFNQNAPVETEEVEQPSVGEEPMAETMRSNPGVDSRRLVKLAGKKIYGDLTNMGQVSIKEILQNSFDAIKGSIKDGLIEKGRISIKTSNKGHTIEMTDNGSGMAPQLLGGKFLEIAGTGKGNEEASGGFGIAKLQFLYGNEDLHVITMRDGKVSELKTTGPELDASLDNKNLAPDIEIRDPNKADLRMFPDGHGTYISITTPLKFQDTDGTMSSVDPINDKSDVPAINFSPLFADIDVDFNGSTVYGIGSNFRSQDYTSFVKVKFPWGTADVYVEKEPNSSRWSNNTHILSNGLWQFSSALKKNPKETYGENIPRTFYIDIHPSVRPEDNGYPFNINRESLTTPAQKDYNKIINYINAIYAIDNLGNEAKSFGEISYFDENGELGPSIDLTPSIPVVDTDFSRIKAGDKVEVKDGRLIVNGKELPELTPDQMKAGIPSADELKMDPSLINSNRVMVHDNVNIRQDDGSYISFNDYMRSKFGERFDRFNFFVGDAFKTLRDEVSSLLQYPDLAEDAIGISVDIKYRGVSTKIPFSGMFLNPFVTAEYVPNTNKYSKSNKILRPMKAGYLMTGTMIHELAHHKVRSHDENFPAEMQNIDAELNTADREGGFPYSWFLDNFSSEMVGFSDILDEGKRIFENESIKPRGNRFKDSQSESVPEGTDGGVSGRDDDQGGGGGAGQRLLGQSAQSTGSTGRRSTSGVGGTGATQAGNVGQQNNALNAQSIAAHVAIIKPTLDFLDKKFGTRFAEAKPFDKQGLAALNSTLPPDQQLSRMPESRNVSDALSDFVARTSGSLQVFIKRHIDPVKKAIIEAAKAGVDPQDIGMYLWARSAPARNLIVAKNNPEFKGAGSGLTNAEAQAIIDDFMRQGKLPTLMRVAKVHDALVDLMLKMRVDNGLMTAADAAALRKEQPLYAPLKGLAFKGDMQIAGDQDPHLGFEELRRSRKGISPREFIKARGRKTAPLNPLLNLTTDAQNLVIRIEKNQAMLPLLNNLLADPIGNADIAKVYTDKKPKRVPGEIDKKTGKRKFKTVNMRGDPSFTVIKKNGLNHYIEFNKDTDAGAAMSRAFANMSPATLNKFHKGYRAFTADIKSLMTRFSPDHIFRVAGMRDLMDSIVTAYASETMPGGAAEGKKVAANTVKYAFSPSTWGAAWRFAGGKDAPAGSEQEQILDLLETMVQDGGSDGRAMIEDAVAQAKDIGKITSRLRGEVKGNPVITTKAGLQMVGDFMTRVMDFNNTVFRFATYRAALKAEIDPADAARLARRATVDLTQKGEWTGMLDDLYFFANPAVQSTIKQGQLLKSRNGRRAMYAFVTFGALTAAWNAMMGGGDDDDDGISNYDNLNDLEKMTNLIIYFGPKKDDYFKVPFGFLVAFPAFTGQKLAEVAMGTTKPESAAVSLMEGAFQIGKAALQTFSPVKVSTSEAADIPSSLTPSILQPVLGLLRNKDYWGKNIYNVPSQYDEKAKSSMGRETTGAGYKWFAKFMNDMSGGEGNVNGWFDFQPEGYRYWINTLGGGPVRTLRNVANLANKDDADVRDIPVIKGWLGSGGEYDAQNSYYENTSKLAAISKAEEDDSEEDWGAKERKFPVQTDANIIDAYKETQKYLRQYYKDLDDALDGVTDAAERRKILDEMKLEKDEIYSEFNRTYNDTKRDMVGSRREVKAK